jgi:hypothetical protein
VQDLARATALDRELHKVLDDPWEQLDYNLLYRCFVGRGVDEPVWVPNRDQPLEADVARKFLAELLEHPKLRGLLSDELFSVDGTQIAAWASMKSFKAKDGSGDPPGPGRNGERDFHGEKPSNATHASSTNPEAQLYRKGRGKEARLSFMGHALIENRSGLIVAATLTKATGTAEREAAEAMIVRHSATSNARVSALTRGSGITTSVRVGARMGRR